MTTPGVCVIGGTAGVAGGGDSVLAGVGIVVFAGAPDVVDGVVVGATTLGGTTG